MKASHIAAIVCAAVVGTAFLFAATYVIVYTYLTTPRNYGITELKFMSSRLWPVIKVVVENNRSVSVTVVSAFVNGSEIGSNSADPPYVYPRLPLTIHPNTRTTLQIEDIYWKWSDPSGTTYAYNVTLVADGTVFTKIEETPYAPH